MLPQIWPLATFNDANLHGAIDRLPGIGSRSCGSANHVRLGCGSLLIRTTRAPHGAGKKKLTLVHRDLLDQKQAN
jgi:hypothetical protein